MTSALWVCLGCGCRYAAGAPRCPECPSSSHVEEGGVPHISVHGGPSNAGDAPEPDPAVPGTTPDPDPDENVPPAAAADPAPEVEAQPAPKKAEAPKPAPKRAPEQPE